MAVIGTLSAGIRRQRIRVRLMAYGAAAAMLVASTMAGFLDDPAAPLIIALGGLVFAVPGGRLERIMFWVAVAFDALAVLALALIADSLLLGGLALGVAVLTLSIGKPPKTIVPVGAVAMTAVMTLLLIEKDILAIPRFVPMLAAPADTYAAVIMTIVIGIAGVTGVRRLLVTYGLAAARVEDSTRRWWAFMERSDDPMLVTIDGLVARVNPAAEYLIGRPARNVQGSDIRELVTADSKITRPDGTVRDVDVVTAPLAIEGHLSEVVFIRDTTEQVRAHRNLERVVRETDRFVATVSHEVRTPLTAVMGLSSVIADSWNDLSDDEVREMVGLIAAESREVSAIVEDLLVAARGRTVGLHVATERVELAIEVARVIDSLRTPGVSLSGQATAIADAARVRQIARNLLTNAVRYGGTDVAVVAATEGGWATVEVSDDGAEIPEHVRDEIFEPFVRADPAGHVASVGLGLNVSRELAHLMGGTLRYEHTGGRSRFRLSLPAAP